ncbi:MAG: Stp1/IreP family PP2C-type Ser/Thr phosphatase [Deltaproteobacteria bacterium]|nr:Stp1/IreP family PP2C-type Ser/Thr phosphatase [Deltaproteobacteria bacterium]
MKLVSFGKTHVGMKRSHNEDAFYRNDEIGLYIVADGMGGHKAGEIASNMAVDSIKNYILNQKKVAEQSLVDAIYIANNLIFKSAAANAHYSGMGTTIVSMAFNSTGAMLCHVGDSRAYILTRGKLERLTEDHTYVNEQFKTGLITEKQMETHSMRNVLTRSLGFSEQIKIASQKLNIHAGDRYLLCSDGLSHMVADNVIAELGSIPDAVHAVSTLIEVANTNGGDDNITAIIIDVTE